MDLHEHEVKASNCVNCNARLDGAAIPGKDDVRPSPGDFSVCVYCGEIMRFDDDLVLVKLEEEDIPPIHLGALQAAQHIVKLMREEKDRS